MKIIVQKYNVVIMDLRSQDEFQGALLVFWLSFSRFCQTIEQLIS